MTVAVLTTSQMRTADQGAVRRGVASLALMEAAGQAVALQAATRLGRAGRALVLCGPGNNGGDGFVAARHLASLGWTVTAALLGPREGLSGDAVEMAARFDGAIGQLDTTEIHDADVVIDGLFGAGLTRPLEGDVARIVEAANASGLPIIAIDVPSGLDGNTGTASGAVVRATDTVTFFRPKPGHLLFPGRRLCGQLHVVDIGIEEAVLDEIAPQTFLNAPSLWRAILPWPQHEGHKYSRGHSLVVSGGLESTGAARLAARAALRVGSGLVTIATPIDAVSIHASQATAVMLKSFATRSGLAEILSDRRKNAVLIGPGRGVGPETADDVTLVLNAGANVVLDADALTSFTGQSEALAGQIMSDRERPVVVTPHDGEFKRLFPDLDGCRLDRARTAAKALMAVVVLKGPDTVIADPSGRAAINTNAPPDLATAGSGDVLAGLITGLLAAGMPAFEASAAAVWMHGEAAATFGPGLIAEDLPEVLPNVLRGLKS